MRNFAVAFTLVGFSMAVASAEEFRAVVKSVDGSKVTLVKFEKGKKGKGEDVTLTAADGVKVSKGKLDRKSKTFEGTAVAAGLKSDLFKNPVMAQVVTDDNEKITEIRLLNVNEFYANIKKVDGTKITLARLTGFGKDSKEGDETTLTAADKIKVTKGTFDKETKKFSTSDVEDGLKNDAFKSTVRGRVILGDDGKIIEIRLGDGGRGFGFGKKKKKSEV